MRLAGLVVGLTGILIFYGWLQHGQLESGPYGYDESDYMQAAVLGSAANAWDTPSRSLAEFISVGVGAVIHRGSTSRVGLSQLAREGTDINFLRHTHGPLYFYWLALSRRWAPSEGAMRRWSQIFQVLSIVVIFAGCLWVVPGRAGVMAAVLSATLYACSAAILGTRELTPHPAFGLSTSVSLFCATKAIETGSRKSWYAAIAVAGVAFTTIELAFTCVVALVFLAWWERKGKLALNRSEVWRSVLAFLLPAVILWPAGLLKLAIVKSYLFMGYLATVGTSEWGRVSFARTWMNRFISSPVEWLCVAIALGLWAIPTSRSRRNPAFPFLVFGICSLAVLLRVNTETLRYMIPYLPAFHVFSGIVLARYLLKMRPVIGSAVLGGMLLLLGWNGARFVERHPKDQLEFVTEILQSVRDQNLTHKRLLVPQADVPMLHFYFPQAQVTGFASALNEPPPSVDAILLPGQTRFASVDSSEHSTSPASLQAR